MSRSFKIIIIIITFFLLFSVFCLAFETVFLCSSGWPRTLNPPVLASWVPELWAGTILCAQLTLVILKMGVVRDNNSFWKPALYRVFHFTWSINTHKEENKTVYSSVLTNSYSSSPDNIYAHGYFLVLCFYAFLSIDEINLFTPLLL